MATRTPEELEKLRQSRKRQRVLASCAGRLSSIGQTSREAAQLTNNKGGTSCLECVPSDVNPTKNEPTKPESPGQASGKLEPEKSEVKDSLAPLVKPDQPSAPIPNSSSQKLGSASNQIPSNLIPTSENPSISESETLSSSESHTELKKEVSPAPSAKIRNPTKKIISPSIPIKINYDRVTQLSWATLFAFFLFFWYV